MPAAPTSLTRHVRSALAAAADRERAEQMQRYMKSVMPFRGVPAGQVDRIVRQGVAEHPVPNREAWLAAISDLYDGAAFREERYAALRIAGLPRHRSHLDPEAMPWWRHVVVTGAWWDLVDATAGLVDDTLRAHRAVVRPVLWSWAQDDDLWLRRVAIIGQLRARSETDLELLEHAVLCNASGSRHGDEFFIRKAIGWALRQYARTDPAWVRAFVDAHADALSGLSRREALKHLG